MDDKTITNRIDPGLMRQVQQSGAAQPGQRSAAPTPVGPAFGDVLAREIAGRNIKFSAHAQARINSRNIEFTGERMERLQDAVDKAEAKGSKDALVLLDGVALVVSIKNRTVITAVDGESIKDNVFTNIDSAVIT